MRLAHPLYLILLLIPMSFGFFYWWVRRRDQCASLLFGDPKLLARITELRSRPLRTRGWALRISVVTLLILALSGPQWGYRWLESRHQGLEIIVALDTSKSMLAEDIKPNRLERSKLAIKDLLAKVKADKIGLVAFAGSSFLQCPLTLDYNAFTVALDALTVQSIPKGGTNLEAAVHIARQAFQSGSGGGKVLIILSDGENHEGNPMAEARHAASEGIRIFTVGIGSPTGELIIVHDANGNGAYLKDESGNPVKTVLNESILRQIAAAGQGVYVRGTGDSLGLEGLYRSQLAGVTRGELSGKWEKRYIDRYQIPLLIALLLLMAEMLSGKKIPWPSLGKEKPEIASDNHAETTAR